MIYEIKLRSEQNNPVIHFLNLTIFLFLFRTAVPFFKYPFILSYSALLIFSLFKYRKEVYKGSITFLKEFYLPLILLIITTIAFLLSNKFYLIIFKDLVNAFILFSLFFLLNILLTTKDELNLFIKSILNQVVLFGLVISVYELGVLLNIFSVENYAYFSDTKLLSNSYLEIDNNFGILPVIFGLAGIFCLELEENSRAKRILFHLVSMLFAICIFFSGSRRGIIALVIIILAAVVLNILRLFISEKEFLKRIRPGFLVSSLIVTLVLVSFGSFTTYSFKNSVLSFSGSRNITIAKQNIAAVIFKYKSSFNRNRTYLDYYYDLWKVVPEDPESGWGYRKHSAVYPLNGENVEIVPSGSIGYLQDNTCDYSSWSGNAYSFTQVGSKNVDDGSIINASVFCYVSEDFNGEWISFSAEGSIIGSGDRFYDLKKKGTWQKLDLSLPCTPGSVSLFLYFSKYGVSNFSQLNGYVVFAFPTVSVITGVLSKANSSAADGYNVNSAEFPKKRPPIRFITKTRSLSAFDLSSELGLISVGDPIRNWAATLISEDTVYHGIENKFLLDSHLNNTSDQRLVRWKFALQVFFREYSLKQKIFGNGFIHLNWYGYYFLKDKTKSDWPHNPFLSVLLYSGILGLSLYFFFMYRVFYYYIKYVKLYSILFIFFIITFFFSFFSGGSPFDPPIMGFFSILPFFIHSVHKRTDKASKISK